MDFIKLYIIKINIVMTDDHEIIGINILNNISLVNYKRIHQHIIIIICHLYNVTKVYYTSIPFFSNI